MDSRSSPAGAGAKKRRLPLVVRALRPIWAKCNDFSFGVQTIPLQQVRDRAYEPTFTPPATPFPPKHGDSCAYEVPDYSYLRKVGRMLNPTSGDVVYDLGCGMGRFLWVMARYKVQRCVGVELQPQLCEIARKNAQLLRRRQAPVEIVCADAATVNLSRGTIYYLYNPFGADTLRDVLTNLRRSLMVNPRTIRIVYYNAVHEWLFSQECWLEKYHQFKTYSRMPVTFWRNRVE